MLFRKAGTEDVAAIVRIFEETHTCEERGETNIGWVRGVYPTEKTAQDAIKGTICSCWRRREASLVVPSSINCRWMCTPEHPGGRKQRTKT